VIALPQYEGTAPCVDTYFILNSTYNCSRTFYCPTINPNQCWGPHGKDIIASFAVQYDSVKTDDR
jgi:hypothetical protein